MTRSAYRVAQRNPSVQAGDEITVNEGQSGNAQRMQLMSEVQPPERGLPRLWKELQKGHCHGAILSPTAPPEETLQGGDLTACG